MSLPKDLAAASLRLLKRLNLPATAQNISQLTKFFWPDFTGDPCSDADETLRPAVLKSLADAWVTPRHAAELMHCSPQLVHRLITQNALAVQTVPNPHHPEFAAMRLIRLSALQDWLKAHPGSGRAPTSRSTRRTTENTAHLRLRTVSAQLGELSDKRPLSCLWLKLLGWEADSSTINHAKQIALPILQQSSPSDTCLVQTDGTHTVWHFDFPSIGYAEFITTWMPQNVQHRPSGIFQLADHAQFFGRDIAEPEAAHYPPEIVWSELQKSLQNIPLRFF
ncbi:MAG: hypothetical protein OWS74_09420 [Firmicutes bacterium]|nr:hypothetical protein [Bacillota bacterium]